MTDQPVAGRLAADERAAPRPGRAFAWLPRISLWGVILPAALLALLELSVAIGLFPARLMPPPSAIVVTLQELYGQGLLTHIGVSSSRVLAGYSIALALALPIGALVGLSRRAESIIDPTFQALRAIPGLAWVPLLLLWLGIDEWPKLTLIAIGAFFPIYLGLIAGIRNVDRKLVEVGEMYGLGPIALVRRIFLPAAMPSVFTGLRQGLSLAWMCLVAAELIAATQGLGYLLTDGREVSRPDIVIAAILILALLGKSSDTLLKAVEQRTLYWRDSFETRLGA
jgi:sulfonate transport system permease protein